jgi:hypothetical protein
MGGLDLVVATAGWLCSTQIDTIAAVIVDEVPA